MKIPQSYWTAVNNMNRHQLVCVLEGHAIGCDDGGDTDDELRQAIIDNIEQGEIDPSEIGE